MMKHNTLSRRSFATSFLVKDLLISKLRRQSFLQILLYAAFAASSLIIAGQAQAQTNFFWNGADITASPAAGGTGTWSTTDAWRTVNDTGSQATWSNATASTNAGFLAGTAGTITLGTTGNNFTGSSLTVQTTGYTITTSSASRNAVFTGALTLADNVGFTLTNSGTGGNLNSFGSIAFGTSSILQIQGGATANNANRVNLTGGGTTTSGGNITLAGTGAGVTGFVSTASITSGGVNLNTNILNNSGTSATMLGATSGNLLIYGGSVSGSGRLQISAGQSGGAGITVLNGTNTYTADTFLNTGTNHVTRIGASNTLPSGTTVFFGASAGGGTADNGGSIDLNGRNLTVGGIERTAVANVGITNNTSDLSTLTIGKSSGTNTFGGSIGTVSNTNSNLTSQSNNIALVKNGGSTQIFAGANTYTGTTTVNAGTLAIAVGGTHTGGGAYSVSNGGTLIVNGSIASAVNVAAGGNLSGTGTLGALTINGSLAPGNSIGTINTGTVVWNGALDNTQAWKFELGTSNASDRLNITGGFTRGTGTIYAFDFLNTTNLGSFTLAQWTTGPTNFTANDFSYLNLGGGNSGSFEITGNSLRFTAVPEPSSVALLSLVGLGGVVARRFRKGRAG